MARLIACPSVVIVSDCVSGEKRVSSVSKRYKSLSCPSFFRNFSSDNANVGFPAP